MGQDGRGCRIAHTPIRCLDHRRTELPHTSSGRLRAILQEHHDLDGIIAKVGVPRAVLHHPVGGLLNFLYEALFWAMKPRKAAASGPLLVVTEKPVAILGKDANGPAKAMVHGS